MLDWCRNLETAICFQGHNTLELKTRHLNCVPRADPRVRRGGKYETRRAHNEEKHEDTFPSYQNIIPNMYQDIFPGHVPGCLALHLFGGSLSPTPPVVVMALFGHKCLEYYLKHDMRHSYKVLEKRW